MRFGSFVYVGLAGWTSAALQQSFYPADLPEDWLLSYYNTRFAAVYLPADAWRDVSAVTWAQWLNDTQEGFYFVLEPATPAASPPASARVLLADSAWSDEHIWWLDDCSDLRKLAQRIDRQAAAGEPLFVFSRVGDLPLVEQVNALREVMGY